MSFSPPSGVTFHIEDIPVTTLSAVLQRVVAFLQGLELSSVRLRLYHDWWEHDGLHFPEGRVTFEELLAMVGAPSAILQTTPIDDSVFVGIAPDDAQWYLRFRVDTDLDEHSTVGSFAVILPLQVATAFKTQVAESSGCSLVEESSESYYRSVMR